MTAGTTEARIGTLLAVALIFGVVNAVVKPIVKIVGCAFYVLTLGLFALVVNALLFLVVGWVAARPSPARRVSTLRGRSLFRPGTPAAASPWTFLGRRLSAESVPN